MKETIVEYAEKSDQDVGKSVEYLNKSNKVSLTSHLKKLSCPSPKEEEYKRLFETGERLMERYLSPMTVLPRKEDTVSLRIDNFSELMQSNKPIHFEIAPKVRWVSWVVRCKPLSGPLGKRLDLFLDRVFDSEVNNSRDLEWVRKNSDAEVHVRLKNQIAGKLDNVRTFRVFMDCCSIWVESFVFYSDICKLVPGFIENDTLIFEVTVKAVH